ncbi:30351_t:CDS:2, partial [Gigaspora margarita]
MISWILILIITFTRFTTCQNGYGFKSPPMGWNPYNAFSFTFDETIIRKQADIIATEGYLDVGYRYINLDDSWQAPNRTANGTLTYNTD